MNKFDEVLAEAIKLLKQNYFEHLDGQEGLRVSVHKDAFYSALGHLDTALTQAAEIERGDKVVVDREPTDAMMKAGWEHIAPNDRALPNMIYKAMIKASEGK